MNARGEYGRPYIGAETSSQEPFGGTAPIEAIRKQAAEIAAHASKDPKTRNVIVVSAFPGGFAAPSFNSVEEADASMAFQRSAAHKAAARGERDVTSYVAYFEKGTLKRLLEWDKQRDKQEPAQWRNLSPEPYEKKPKTEATWGKWVVWALGGAAVVGVGLMARSAHQSMRELQKLR